MANIKKTKPVIAVAVAVLLFLVLLLWLFLGNTNGFFIVAVSNLSIILAIFLYVSVLHIIHQVTDMAPKHAHLTAAASVVALTALVAALSVRGLKIRKTFFFVAAVNAAIFLGMGFSLLVKLQRKQARRRQLGFEEDEVRIEYNFLRRVAGLPAELRYEELAVATDDFQQQIGKGSSGSVYKGILDDGTPVAVKRIEGETRQRKREFVSEVAAIASVQHANLVRLLGYCLASGTQRLLVYEFIGNGSLNGWIFPGQKGCLTWEQRYRVAVDVAKAMSYIHHDCRTRVLHLDIKPENILLDESLRAYVSDFGLSRLMEKEESNIYTTVRGTRGYFAPEWFMDGGVSEKCDVYSYGMVLLELVGGRRNMVFSNSSDGDGDGNYDQNRRQWSYFPRIVSEKVRDGKLMEVVDERLLGGGGVEEREVRLVVHVALWCVQDKPELRPSMARVVGMLEGNVVVEPPPSTPMFMVDLLSADSGTIGGGGGGPTGYQLATTSSSSLLK